MTKKLLLLLTAFTTSFFALAQSILPTESTEFCPLTDITFTVTLPRIADNTVPNVVSWTNTPMVVSNTNQNSIAHTASTTTFTFVGRFRDLNINQVFKIEYSPKDGPPTSHFFHFKKIKSLASYISCSQVPNQGVITVPRCQVVNIPISFTNVTWGTSGEATNACFGTITTYEYQLPAGWSIGSTVSTGSIWIPGSNSVTVTSDLSTGDEGVIRIRPANNCAAGLLNAQVPGGIPVSRPAPVLNITAADNFIMCNGTSKSFSISGVPAGASVVWSLSNTSYASIIGANNGTTVTVQGDVNNSTLNLIATVTDCGTTYTKTQSLYIGTPVPTNLNVSGHCNSGCGRAGQVILGCNSVPTATSYDWYVDGAYIGRSTVNFKTMPTPYICGKYYTFSVVANGACGPSLNATTVSFQYTACFGYSITAGPNPTTGELNVEFEGDAVNQVSSQTVMMEMIDVNTNQVVKRWQPQPVQKRYSLNIASLKKGLYLLRLSAGQNIYLQKIMKN